MNDGRIFALSITMPKDNGGDDYIELAPESRPVRDDGGRHRDLSVGGSGKAAASKAGHFRACCGWV